MEYDPRPYGEGGAPEWRPSARQTRKSAPFERRTRLLALYLAAPGFLLAALLLWRDGFSWSVAAGILGGAALFSLIAGSALMEQVVRPLQTLANVVASLREGDYSFRARGSKNSDALGELALEINTFADTLQDRRVSEMEATALLRCVVSSMDAPLLAFDPARRLRLINPAAMRIFHLTEEHALGRSAENLQLAVLLDHPDQEILVLGERSNPVHWMVRKSSFRQGGIPHTLLLLSDVSIALREQERDAWQRLIRVIGHEINNSLTPIKSIAGSLRSRLHLHPEETRSGLESDPAASLDRGLRIIESRAESLNRFIQAYRQLAQLPSPELKPVSLQLLLERAVALETRVAVHLEPGPKAELQLDSDLFEQLIINLLRNAAESVMARIPHPYRENTRSTANRDVTVTWKTAPQWVEILIRDEGIGLTNPSNLFVPFYTTKPGGSGIGLALARQICEAHGGALRLVNRDDGPGCLAEIRLPWNRRQASLHASPDRKIAGSRIAG